ncbi:hypothetical protein WME93_06345 [Sorangium sp. So ce1000]
MNWTARPAGDGASRSAYTESSAEVFALMRRFNRELGTTFLVVTHDPRIAEQCDRVIEIVDGRIANDRA